MEGSFHRGGPRFSTNEGERRAKESPILQGHARNAHRCRCIPIRCDPRCHRVFLDVSLHFRIFCWNFIAWDVHPSDTPTRTITPTSPLIGKTDLYIVPVSQAIFLTYAHQQYRILPIDDTAKLIIHFLSVDLKWVHPLPFDTPSVIPNTGGVQVTLIEANHCP